MTDTYNYSGGPIDLSWQTAPWNQDGETIEKPTENQEGTISMTELPSEVNKDELTDLQEKIIRTAVRNPELSTSQIDEIAECGKHYSSNILNEKVPEWYENTFKKTGKSTDTTRNDRKDDYKSSAEVLAEETGRDKEEFELDDDTEVPNYPHPSELESAPQSEQSHKHDYRDNTTDSPEWQSYAVVALLSFVFGLLWGGRDE